MTSSSHFSRVPLNSTSSSSAVKARKCSTGKTSEKPLQNEATWALTPSSNETSSTRFTYRPKLSIVTVFSAPWGKSSTSGCPGRVKSRPSSDTAHPSRVSAAIADSSSAGFPPALITACLRVARACSRVRVFARCGLISARSAMPSSSPRIDRRNGTERGRSTSLLSSMALATKRPMKVKSCTTRAGTPTPSASCCTAFGKSPKGV
mmetsp:Transcript_40434/g.100372  ORF Transcript_40434/g.100372 Transcript_40434/m.100372 type:complete len:206 (+) Transcript_40434:878-1495(+)